MAFDVRTISSFDRAFKRLKKKYPSLLKDLAILVGQLETDPTQGSALGRGCYKVRMPISSKGQGKSGGARVITYVKIVNEIAFLLTIYDKSEKGDLEANELDDLLEQLPE